MEYRIYNGQQAQNRISQANLVGVDLNYLVLGCTPHEESCTQAGGNYLDSIAECKALIGQLTREITTVLPKNTFYFILESYREEAGNYYEAAIFYNEDNEGGETDYCESEEYALEAEASLPDHWDEQALIDLRRMQYSLFRPAKIIQMRKTG